MVSPENRGLVVLKSSRVYKNRNREAAQDRTQKTLPIASMLMQEAHS